MKKALLAAALSVLGIFFAANCAANELSFSANVTHTYQKKSVSSKIYIKGKKVRLEGMNRMDGGYTIVRPDLQKTWIVMPRKKTYLEVKTSRAHRLPEARIQGEVTRKQLGSEIILGHPAIKYEVTYKNKKRTLKMYQWMATDINFPIKQQATDGSWSIEYRNLKMGPQADKLFKLPKGYKLRKTPKLPPGNDPETAPKPAGRQ